MDNATATACKKCNVIIFYDKDAKKPDLCKICEKIAEAKKETDK